jgi:hypothetical protein
MTEHTEERNTETINSENLREVIEKVAGTRCKICDCEGFVSDPTDITICIAASVHPLPGHRCQHSYLNH